MLVLWLDILSQFWIEYVWPCFISTHLTFQVSQGSAATDLRWGENFNKFLFRNSFVYIQKQWKNYENRSTFVRVIKQESRAVAGNPRDAAVIFEP